MTESFVFIASMIIIVLLKVYIQYFTQFGHMAELGESTF
jgi:hypothetical protein